MPLRQMGTGELPGAWSQQLSCVPGHSPWPALPQLGPHAFSFLETVIIPITVGAVLVQGSQGLAPSKALSPTRLRKEANTTI